MEHNKNNLISLGNPKQNSVPLAQLKYKPQIGEFVSSLSGHDAGSTYMIVKIEEPFVWLCDGDYKKIDKPKKKRIKHVKLSNVAADAIKEKIEKNKIVHNEEIYSAIKKYKEKGGV